MVGSNVDQRVFAELVAERYPQIAKHLHDIGLPIVIVSLPWFLCLFITYVPMEAALRILDCEGDTSVCAYTHDVSVGVRLLL
jgi:hypothetical protein